MHPIIRAQYEKILVNRDRQELQQTADEKLHLRKAAVAGNAPMVALAACKHTHTIT
jgi:hypothetical protein